jgi:hypothetical protein
MVKEIGKIKVGCPKDEPWIKKVSCPEDKPKKIGKKRKPSLAAVPSVWDPLRRPRFRPTTCHFIRSAAVTLTICRHPFSKTICSYVGSKEVLCKSFPIPPRHQASSRDSLIPTKTKDGKPLTQKQIQDHKLIEVVWKETFYDKRTPIERIQYIFSKKHFHELPKAMQVSLKDYRINAKSYNEARDRWANSLNDIKARLAFDSVKTAISSVRGAVDNGIKGVVHGLKTCFGQ